MAPRVQRAFRDGALPDSVLSYGLNQAANRWGDARKTLTLFRHAGETANERGLDTLDQDCISANLEQVNKTGIIERLIQLPTQHLIVLDALTSWTDHGTGEIIQPVTVEQAHDAYQELGLPAEHAIGVRALRDIVTDLETMGLVETWIDSRGREGRVKQVETTFDPEWVNEARSEYITESKDTANTSEPSY